MTRIIGMIGALALGLAILAGTGRPAPAADGRVPLPALAAPAEGESCVEPADVMRRNHMEFLKAQRDETMHLGIRDGKYSLNGCIACHAAADPAAADPAAKTIEPFCEECHSYAAVKLDCWSCHNPTLTEELRAHLWDGSKKP